MGIGKGLGVANNITITGNTFTSTDSAGIYLATPAYIGSGNLIRNHIDYIPAAYAQAIVLRGELLEDLMGDRNGLERKHITGDT